MAPSTSERAGQALQELLEVSPKVGAAVVLTRDGEPLAARTGGSADGGEVASDADARELARLAQRLFGQAETARGELGREPVVQLEVATGTAHVFLVSDPQRLALAVTELEPTVGLVFYDLKTALRTLREPAPASAAGDEPAAGSNGGSRRKRAGSSDGGTTTEVQS